MGNVKTGEDDAKISPALEGLATPPDASHERWPQRVLRYDTEWSKNDDTEFCNLQAGSGCKDSQIGELNAPTGLRHSWDWKHEKWMQKAAIATHIMTSTQSIECILLLINKNWADLYWRDILSGSQVILATCYAKRMQPVEQLMKASKCPSRRRGDSWLAFPSFLGQTTSTLLRKLFHVRLNQGFTPLCTV